MAMSEVPMTALARYWHAEVVHGHDEPHAVQEPVAIERHHAVGFIPVEGLAAQLVGAKEQGKEQDKAQHDVGPGARDLGTLVRVGHFGVWRMIHFHIPCPAAAPVTSEN